MEVVLVCLLWVNARHIVWMGTSTYEIVIGLNRCSCLLLVAVVEVDMLLHDRCNRPLSLHLLGIRSILSFVLVKNNYPLLFRVEFLGNSVGTDLVLHLVLRLFLH